LKLEADRKLSRENLTERLRNVPPIRVSDVESNVRFVINKLSIEYSIATF